MYISNSAQVNAVSSHRYAKGTTPSGSDSFAAILSKEQAENNITASTTPTPAVAEHLASLDTNKGEVALDIEDYFSPKKIVGSFDLDEIPLLMPTAKNIEAISQHSTAKCKQMLADYDIPEAPAQIAYGADGKNSASSGLPLQQ